MKTTEQHTGTVLTPVALEEQLDHLQTFNGKMTIALAEGYLTNAKISVNLGATSLLFVNGRVVVMPLATGLLYTQHTMLRRSEPPPPVPCESTPLFLQMTFAFYDADSPFRLFIH